LGGITLCLDEKEPIKFDFKGNVLDKLIPIPKILYESIIVNKTRNTYINLPKLKIHLQIGMTGCIKNQYGLLYNSEKL
jgi:uncharacterized protein (DUF362 family)